MALAQPALRQFGIQKLRNINTRGGTLLGTIIGTAIGLGFNLAADFEVTFPWDRAMQPNRSGRPIVSASIPSQENASNNQYNQALLSYTANKLRSRKRSKSRGNQCCATTRCHKC